MKMCKGNVPRIVIAGTNSGCGKTTITCTLLQHFVNNSFKTISFKCGPDYIDPMFHEKVIGVGSSNLDSIFYDEDQMRELLITTASGYDIAVIEGVMGFYDGVSIDNFKGSTYEISNIINSPVILCVNCKGAANSIVAIIKGFCDYMPDANIKGVILNQIHSSTYSDVKKLIIKEFSGKVIPLGFLPILPKELILESRHLGLVTANEILDIKDKLGRLSTIASDSIDFDAIKVLADKAAEITFNPQKSPEESYKVTIGVAKDNGFCFYYQDNLKALERIGAKIIYFSPINDKKIPNVDGLYFGGGYPELYGKELSENQDMKDSILSALKNGLPCIAECGGFMYLNQAINNVPMVGFLNGECNNTKKLVRFGYVTLTAKLDNLLCKEGESIKGHEFHYYDCTVNGKDFISKKSNGKTWDCVVANGSFYGGYPHLSFASNPDCAKNFLNKCYEEKKRK